MSEVFLYIFGAGASCNALPLVKDFANDLNNFSNNLSSFNPGSSGEGSTLWGGERQNFVDAVRWLGQEAQHHASVDTFAKKLFFRRDYTNLKKLKAVLSTYLTVQQAIRNVDFRYDSFFASILEADKDGSIRLPEKLRVLTWNYDIQLERAFYGFCDDEKMVVKNISLNDDRVYRMNGRCGTNPSGYVDTNWFRAYGSSDAKPWADGIRLYNTYMEQSAIEPEIRFAWEDVVRTRFETTKLDLNEITTIVIIGYSFPYFNREIDDLIFKQFYKIEPLAKLLN